MTREDELRGLTMKITAQDRVGQIVERQFKFEGANVPEDGFH